jgi:hypothetical protein
VNPHTPIDGLQHVLDRLDLILVMTVNPGFGGQSFINAMIDKIAVTKAMIGNRPITIEVDGGVTADNAGKVVAAGARARLLPVRPYLKAHLMLEISRQFALQLADFASPMILPMIKGRNLAPRTGLSSLSTMENPNGVIN